MKHTFFLIIFLLLLSYKAVSQDLKLSPAQSKIEWSGSAAFSSYSLSGTLAASNGNIKMDISNLLTASVKVDMKSLKSENKDLQKHLRSEDFFDIKKHPSAHFLLTLPSEIEDGSGIITGNMTIKGITNNVETEITLRKVPLGWVVQGQLTLDRTDFDIKYNSPSFFKNLKDQAIADIIKVDFTFLFQ